MDRWIAVALSVVLAVSATACDDDASEPDDQSETDQAAAPEAPGLHRTRTGLKFRTPTDWSTEMMAAGAKLLPPEGQKAKDKYLLVIRFAPDDTDDATDGEYLDELASDFTDRVSDAEMATRETGLDNPMGSASYIAWDIDEKQGTKRVGFFVAISDPWMLVLRATGPKSTVEKRRETLESIFASAELTDANTHPKLVGTWKRVDPRQTQRGRYNQTLRLEDNGTLRLTHEPAGKVSKRTLEDIGRWAATDEKLVQYLGNSLRGGVQVKNHGWTIDADGLLHLQGNNQTSTWKPVE